MRKTTSSLFKYTHHPHIQNNKNYQKNTFLKDNYQLNPQSYLSNFDNDIEYQHKHTDRAFSKNQLKNKVQIEDIRNLMIKNKKKSRRPRFIEKQDSIQVTEDSKLTIRTSMAMEQQCLKEHDFQIQNKYIDNNLDYLILKQNRYIVKDKFLNIQCYVTNSVRNNLVIWIMQVNLHFKLHSETLFLSINIIDRILEKWIVLKNNIQILALAAIFIACKIQEIDAPSLNRLRSICQTQIPRQHIFQMESTILSIIQFDLGYSSSICFLNSFLAKNQNLLKDEIKKQANYLIYLMILESRFSNYRPSIISLCGIFLSCKRLRIQTPQIIRNEINRTGNVNEFIWCRNEMIEVILEYENGRKEQLLSLIKKLCIGNEF